MIIVRCRKTFENIFFIGAFRMNKFYYYMYLYIYILETNSIDFYLNSIYFLKERSFVNYDRQTIEKNPT